MSRNNTGNPIGSKAFPDFEDNVKNLDEAVNTADPQWVDRFGRFRLPLMEQERQFVASQESRDDQFQSAQSSREAVFSDFLQASGYQDLGEYAPGIEITAHNQYVTFGGQPYLLKPSIPVPYTTSGEWTGDDFKLIGDDSLRQDLANPGIGAAMVARGVVAVDTIAGLLALPEGQRKEGLRYLVKGYHAGSDVGGGEFYWDASSIATDNGGTVFEVVGEAIGRFVRRFDGAAHVTWFGAIGDGETENQEIPIQKAIDAIRNVYIPAGTYMLNSWINLKSGTTLSGEKSSVLKHTPGFYGTYWGAIRIGDENVRDVTVKGLTLDGSRKDLPNYDPNTDLNTESNSTPLIGIHGFGTSKYPANIHISDVSFIQPSKDSIYIRAPYIKGINVSGCYSYDCGRSHFVVTEGEDITFDRNICIDAKNSMFDIETNNVGEVVRNVTLSNNLLLSQSGVAAGIGLSGAGTQENVIISNNIIHTEGGIIQFGNCSNLIFSGNTCSGVVNRESRGAIESTSGSKDTVFTGNTITIRSALDEGVSARSIWIRSPESITFSNNVFDLVSRGLEIDQGGFGVRIAGNRITSPEITLAIDTPVEGVTITDNEIKSGGFSGFALYLASPDLIFSGNSIDAGDSGIRLYSTSGSYVNNSFTGASTIEVRYAEGGTSSIIGNRMSLQKFESRDVSNLILKDNVMSFENRETGDMVDIQSQTLYADVTGNLIYAEESSSTTGFGVNMRAARYTFTGNSVIDRKSTKTVGAALRIQNEALLGIIQGNTFDTAEPPVIASATDFKPFIPEKTITENLSIFNYLL